MCDVKDVGNGTKTNLKQNTSTLAMENVNMRATQPTTNTTKTVQNGSTRDTVVPGKAWKTRISHQQSLHGCRSTVTDRNVTVLRSCD